MARIFEGDKMNVVGGNIKKWRKKRGLSQQQLSARLEVQAVYVCRGSISRIEDHKRTVTDIELLAFSKALGVPLEALFETDIK